MKIVDLFSTVNISVCDAAGRGGKADNVDLSLAQVDH